MGLVCSVLQFKNRHAYYSLVLPKIFSKNYKSLETLQLKSHFMSKPQIGTLGIAKNYFHAELLSSFVKFVQLFCGQIWWNCLFGSRPISWGVAVFVIKVCKMHSVGAFWKKRFWFWQSHYTYLSRGEVSLVIEL